MTNQIDTLATEQFNLSSDESTTALVVFSDSVSRWWLKMLKPGYRHCFVCLHFEDCYVLINPLLHYTEVRILPFVSVDHMAIGFLDQGMHVLRVLIKEPPKTVAPIRLFSCVEAIKRVLGIHDPWIMTPWQLHQTLINQSNDNEHMSVG